ncbi:MAG TPA: response regulator transcription factor, partial [Actinomycetota bacterium]|nr:response regulator transcription factor [Actinomycetota bacterium]
MGEPNGRITVLVAEDEPAVRAALSDLIEIEEGLELVGAAADAQEAIDLAREHRPDVALVDVKMPAGGGTRAAREIRALS